MKRTVLGLATLLVSLELLFPVQPQKWSFVGSADFLKGTFDGISSESEGLLALAPREEPVEGPAEEYYLSLVEGRDGTMYLGTGHGGKIYRLPRGGRPELYFQTAEMDVTCLTLGDRDVLFAGTSPNGKVYKITAKDAGDVFFNPDEKYIWDLLSAEGGRLLAAVGESGGIYEIDASGSGRRLLKAGDGHILCLAFESNGDLLAGSASSGFLYRVTRAGKASVVFDPVSAEVKAVARDERGNVYLAACGVPVKPRREDVSPAAPTTGSVAVTVTAAGTTTSAAQAGSSMASAAGPSALYRIGPDGRAVKLWSSEEESLYDIVWDEGRKQVLFGTGNRGRLYAVDSAGRSLLLFQKSSEQVTVLSATDGKTTILSNNPARADVLLSEQRTEGEYMSPILDAGALSSWGRITWRGETPSGTSLQLQTRSGNASEPTAAWSEWSPPYKKPEGEAILSPGGRYLQFRALFRKASGRLGPALRLVEAYYLQANAAPVVKKLEALPPNEVFIKPPETEEVILGSPHPSAGDKMGRTDILISLAKKTSRKGFRTLLWEAEDGNGDSLTYSLSVRRAGESGWKLLERDWKEAVFALDTVSLPDGVYDFKVVASDKPSNPAGRELQGEKTSLPLTIDNTPPLFRDVTVSRDGTKLKVGFQAEDALSPLLEIKVLVRPLEWLTVFPVDGICDSMQEAFSFVLDLPAGSDDLLTVVALDAHGNSGVLRQSFPR